MSLLSLFNAIVARQRRSWRIGGLRLFPGRAPAAHLEAFESAALEDAIRRGLRQLIESGDPRLLTLLQGRRITASPVPLDIGSHAGDSADPARVTPNVVLSADFLRSLCRRGYFEVIAAVIIAREIDRLLVSKKQDSTQMSAALALRAAILVGGPSVLSTGASRASDLRLLFDCEARLRAFDTCARRVFFHDLLVAGEALETRHFRQWLNVPMGALSHLIDAGSLESDMAWLRTCAGVLPCVDPQPVRARVRSRGNQVIIGHLLDLIRERNLNVFLGAGVSVRAPAHAPDWTQLKTECFEAMLRVLVARRQITDEQKREYSELVGRAVTKPEVVMQLVHEVIGDRLHGVLDPLARGRHNLNHRFIARAAKLGLIRRVLTTNFDTYMEEALAAEGVAANVCCSEGDFTRLSGAPESEGVAVIKLHGSLHEPASIVMTLRQAARPLSDTAKRVLYHCLGEHPMLVLGYSGNDDDIYPALYAADTLSVRLYWCSRRYGRTVAVDGFLEKLGASATPFEMNLNALMDDLWHASGFGDVPPDVDNSGTTAVTAIDYSPWAQSLTSGEILHILGATFQQVGCVNPATTLICKALDVTRLEGDRRRESLASGALGELSLLVGKYEEAWTFLARAESLRGDLELGVDTPASHEHLRLSIKRGEADLGRGRLDDAEYHLRICQSFAEKLSDASLRGAALEALGDLARARGNRKESGQRYEEAIVDYERAGEPRRLVDCLIKLAEILCAQRRFRRALAALERARTLSRVTGNVGGTGNALIRLAWLHEARHAYQLAKEALDEAVENFRLTDNSNGVEECYVALLRVHDATGDSAAALRTLDLLMAYFAMRYSDKSMYYARAWRSRADAIHRRRHGIDDAAPLSPEETYATDRDIGGQELVRERVRCQSVIDGRTRVDDLREIVFAHKFLADYWLVNDDYEAELRHVRQLQLAQQLMGASKSDVDRTARRVAKLERYRRRDSALVPDDILENDAGEDMLDEDMSEDGRPADTAGSKLGDEE